MAKKSKTPKIKLAHPDRSAAPSEKTLLSMAQQQNLFEQAEVREQKLRQRKRKQRKRGQNQQKKDEHDGEGGEEEEEEEEDAGEGEIDPTMDHILDSFFWGVSLSMLHFTLDLLVQHQYAMTIEWRPMFRRWIGALLG